MSKFHIGIDLGGTKIESILLDSKYKILFRERVPTHAEKGSDYVVNQINNIYRKTLNLIQDQKHTLGIGTPGSICSETNLLRNSTIHSQNGLPLKSILQKKLKHEFIIENDANCFALAEALLGAGKGMNIVFGVIMGTGCGGGIVINKELLIGPSRLAGEWGHTIINPNGPKCFCGKKGCISEYISGTGIENLLFAKLKKKISSKKFFEKKIFTDKEKDVLKTFYKYFGMGLGNLINIIDPDVIILGGGLSNHPPLYTEGIKEIYKNVFCENPSTPIVKNKLGDSAGVIGAALLGAN